MNARSQGTRWLGWGCLAVSVLLWIGLLAFLPIPTAAMGKAAPLLAWLRAVWGSSEEMGHGPFLPLISLYVIGMRRRAIGEAAGAPDARGVAVMLVGAFLFWIGLKTEDVRIFLAAMVLWSWGIPFAALGAGVARQLVFPAAYLLLAIPIDNLVIFFTMRLRLFAAAVAVAMANGLGIATTRIGTGLHSAAGAGFNLDVADPCSGLRSIFAMTALAAAYAFFTQRGLWRQWMLFACAVPVAVIGNIVRIVAIVIVAAWLGEETATGFYHDYSGYLVFLVALLLLVEIGRRLSRWKWPDRGLDGFHRRRPPGGATEEQAPVPFPSITRRLVAWILSPLLLLACGLMVLFEPPVQPGSLAFLPASLPRDVGGWSGSPLWHCHDEQCLAVFSETQLRAQGVAPIAGDGADAAEAWPPVARLQPGYRCPACETGLLYTVSPGEQRQLPADTRLLRSRYESPGGGESFTVTLVASGTDRGSLHRPELCLPAQGFVMTAIRLAGTGDGASVKRMELERAGLGGRARIQLLYWFFNGERQTASHLVRLFWTAWDRALHHKAPRWVMVTVVADAASETDRDSRGRLTAFTDALRARLHPPPLPAPF